MIRFFILFLVIQSVLFLVELTEPVQQAFVTPFTEGVAGTASWLVQLFDNGVHADGIVLRDMDNGFAVAIRAGCNGVEAIIVLAAAILAFPAPWRHKALGFAVGFLAIQALNMVRIISLFYLGQWNEDWFQWAHLYLWQALIMLDALVVFLVWLRTLPARETPAGTQA